jgi:hypothetical protein
LHGFRVFIAVSANAPMQVLKEEEPFHCIALSEGPIWNNLETVCGVQTISRRLILAPSRVQYVPQVVRRLEHTSVTAIARSITSDQLCPAQCRVRRSHRPSPLPSGGSGDL